jgi:WD40 repeat protein
LFRNQDISFLLIFHAYMLNMYSMPPTIFKQVNVVQYDKEYRYIGVGCRDKTFTIFDTSTFVPIKVFHTPSWVTSVSWTYNNIVSIRSELSCVSILDLSSIQKTRIFQTISEKQQGTEGFGALSWSNNGQYLMYITGSRIVIVDTQVQFRECASYSTKSGAMATNIIACIAPGKTNLLACIDDDGWLYVLRFQPSQAALELVHERMVEPNLKALGWSPDGEILLVGGRKKLLHVFKADSLEAKNDPITFQGRIWDVDFVPRSTNSVSLYCAVALGDYTTVILDRAMEPILEISRTLTCRCLKFHPSQPVLAIGDGAGTVAIIDCDNGEVVTEIDLSERVTALDFSPVGDYMVVGTDGCNFSLYESQNFRLLQNFPSNGRALCASFSSNGFYLALGSTVESYSMIRLGPFLGTEFIPLNLPGGVTSLPESELKQVLFHSGKGPSLLQRHMVRGGPDNLRRVAAILQEHPNAIYTLDRCTGEGCFDTALRLKRPGLLKLFIVSIVDGTLNKIDGKHKTFLATSIPQRGRDVLTEIVKNYPADFIVDILRSITFMKVPYGLPRPIESGDRVECGHTTYHDPWPQSDASQGRIRLERSAKSTRYFSCGGSIRTPAVLPLPGLGNMSLLANLLVSSPAEVFDNDAMALVLRVLWKNYIRRYYYFDFCVFVTYYLCWIVLVETATILSPTGQTVTTNISVLAVLLPMVLLFNTLFAAKELVEGIYGMKYMYWRSMWNMCDWMGIVSVYSYTINLLYTGNHLVPLAVGTTLCLTIKVLSYLRGFSSTGWLLSVLSANFQDVQGFLVIVTTILVGFSVAFRLLFAGTGEEAFGSLRRALLSTFELTVMGSYDTMILFETQYTVIAVITFIMAVTCIVVVVLNALISILSDSYAKVQEHAVANRRREIASLIVEYMTLLPRWRRQQIERETTWFHTLLEVDADGSLQVHSEDWEGGLNALRHDMEEMGRLQQQGYERAVERMKTELDTDLTKFKKEVVTLLEDLTDDVKYLRKVQSQGILSFDGHHIKKAVRAVKSVGRKGGDVIFHKGAGV